MHVVAGALSYISEFQYLAGVASSLMNYYADGIDDSRMRELRDNFDEEHKKTSALFCKFKDMLELSSEIKNLWNKTEFLLFRW